VASRSFTAIQNSKWVFKLLGPKSIPLIPPYQGPFRTNLVQFIFKNTFLSKLAKVILRGIVVVKVAELSYSWVQSDYEKWVNQRVGDQVFKKEVWAFTKQDRWVIPILFKPFRIGSRFLAKNLWNAAVAQDHQGLKMKIYETDLINSRKKETILKKKLVPLLTLDNFGGLKVPEVLQVLQHPIQKASLPLKKKIAAKFGIGPQDLELAVKEIQQSAKFLYQVGQLRNDWARKVFKKDGTLKGGLEYRDVLQHFSAGMF
jgi:hypothetical protein